MNIFVLSEDPYTAAQMMCDKHIPKMVVESAQMLSTAHRMLDGKVELVPSKSGKRTVKYWRLLDNRENLVYKPVHMNHPCTVWTMKTSDNYNWHRAHFDALCNEFSYRFGKRHKTSELLGEVLYRLPDNIPSGPLTPFALAMKAYPECIVEGDAVTSYRNYYHMSKPFAKWEKTRPAPNWWEGYKGH